MVWYWWSYWENNSSSWKEHYAYRARSRVAWRSEAAARRAAQAHTRRTGYATKVSMDDGRKWRGKIR